MSFQDLFRETQRIYKDLPVGLCYLDTDLRFVHINNWLAEINGIPAEEHLGRTIGELIPDVAAFVEPQYRQVIDTGEPIVGGTVEAETAAQPGVKKHFRHSYYPVRSDDGAVIGISCVVEDITVRNEAVAALRQANDELERRVQERTAELREANESLSRQITERERAEQSSRQLIAAIDIMEECIALFDADDRLVFCNKRVKELNSAAPETLIPGVTFEDQMKAILARGLVPEAQGREDDWLRERLERHRNPKGPFELLRQDGLWLLMHEQRLPEGGIITFATDITERKYIEEQLRQAQKMEVVGQLTAGVAHDFNNMLAVISGNAEQLEMELGTDNPRLTTVYRATARAAELTQRLLAFSRRQVLNPEIINTNSLIAVVTGLLRRSLEEHIEIETAPAAGLWNCEVDPAQLENALVNLAINARDAMPDGGKLTIETANTPLDDDYAAAQAEVKPGQYVMLAVTDTGTGMPPEVRDRVFEPFFTTKEVGKGSGLGLSMIYGFVKQSGGHVTIYSEEGEGTTVKLYLPRSTQSETADKTPATSEAPVARGETILVVEDDPDLRTLAVALLSSLGYQVVEAATGPAALEHLDSANGINLLLTDVVLPGGINGRELAAEIERRAPGIPVLYMSGYTEDAIMHHGRLDANAELLQKPFRKVEIARAVRKLLDCTSS